LIRCCASKRARGAINFSALAKRKRCPLYQKFGLELNYSRKLKECRISYVCAGLSVTRGVGLRCGAPLSKW